MSMTIQTDPMQANNQQTGMSTKMIFIVEDNPAYAKLLEAMLRSKFSEIEAIRHFETGEACLMDLYQNPAVIIIDHLLNTNNITANTGLSTVKKIITASPNTNVILLSAQKEFDVVSKTITKYGCTYVQKDEQAFAKVEQLIRDIFQKQE